ncbi:hypothetical protein [Desulfurococcus amylolyticus]|uniref:hypothetical protein n=1 Tax=Desulfurococcus amylolyticus TaxID=94694 RepID=UPI0005B21D84|nr:hypothetical protein [Desulfurococcus amylolyticus]
MVTISVRVSREEKELVEKLAQYLYALGKIREPTVSEAVRLCLRFTVNEMVKAIERGRYTG